MGNAPPHPEELAAMLETAIAAKRGVGSVIVVIGERGSGKTRLAEDLGREGTRAGLTVLCTSCEAAPDAPRLWPWLQLLRQYLRAHGDAPFSPALEEAMADVIELVPGLDRILDGRALPEELDLEAARFRLFDAVAQVLRRASEAEPMLLLIDDLQAAEEASLAMIRHVAGELAHSRVVLIILSRPLSSRSPLALRSTIETLERARGSRRVELARPAGSPKWAAPGLSSRESEVAALVAEGLSNREIAERIGVSERTAENHVQNILNKLGQTTRAQIAAWVAGGMMSIR